jgi:hypothetical protein
VNLHEVELGLLGQAVLLVGGGNGALPGSARCLRAPAGLR